MLSSAEEGALVGVRIEEVRYAAGKVDVRIHALFDDEGLSTFWAAFLSVNLFFFLFFFW